MLQAPSLSIKLKLELFNHNWEYQGEITEDVSGDIGEINCTNQSAIRRSMSLNLTNDTKRYLYGENKLLWLNKRIKVYLGISAYGRPFEFIPQGTFVLSSPSNYNGLNGTLASIELQDLAYLYTDKHGVIKNYLELASGLKITDAIKLVANGGYSTRFLFDDIQDTIPYTMSYNPNTSRWQIISELAQKAKCHVYFDVEGLLRLRKIDLAEVKNYPEVWSFKNRDKNEKFYVESTRRLEDSNLANCVMVLGGNANTSIFLYDIEIDETADPKWVGHPYSIQRLGRIQYFHNDGNIDGVIDTQELATYRARYELMKRCGYDEILSMTIHPHYLLEPDDVIYVFDEDNAVDSRYMIETISIPLSPQNMTMECRRENRYFTDWDIV